MPSRQRLRPWKVAWARPPGAGIPQGLLAMLGLAVLIECGVQAAGSGLSQNVAQWLHSARAATQEAAACEVLCLGDSLATLGILPRALEKRTGKRVYNLAGLGMPPPGSYFLLRRALEAGARPSAVVLAIAPGALACQPSDQLEGWWHLLSLRESLEYSLAARDPGLLARLVAGRVLPSLRFRAALRARFRARRLWLTPTDRAMQHALARNWSFNRGAVPFASRPIDQNALTALHAPRFAEFHCTRANRLFLDRLLVLCARHQITVFWVLAPVVPEVDQCWQQNGAHDRFRAFLYRLQARCSNLVVVDALGTGYEPRAFMDPVHLALPGAVTLSNDLGTVLTRYYAHGSVNARWVRLPRFHPQSPDFPIEDLFQSQLALRDAWLRKQAR